MRVVVVSAFRNMSGRIHRYLSQVASLREHLNGDGSVRVVAVEGDSTDNTPNELLDMATRLDVSINVVTHNHGQRVFGSTEEPDRMKALTGVMIAGFGAVDPSSDDVVLYVESDLLWSRQHVGALLDMAYRREDNFDVISPLIFAGYDFYDVWAFRKNGQRFTSFPPYHPELAPTGLTEVDSVGSCLCVCADLAVQVAPVGEAGLVSWSAGARANGLRIGVTPDYRVTHPC